MKRSERVSRYLAYAYEIVKDNDNKEVYNRFYDFLIENRADMDFISEEMYANFNIEIEDVIAHKNDMIMDVVKGFYSAIRFYMLSGDVNEEEEMVVNFIDAQEFTFVDIVQYFIHPEKESIAKIMIEIYCILMTQSNNFVNQVTEYNNNNPTDFLEEVNETIKYLDIIDEMADVYGSAFDDKTTDELDKEANSVDDYDSDEEDYLEEEEEVFVSEKVGETVQHFLQILVNNYGDLQSEKMNKFLGYYLSLAYPLFLDQKEMKMPEAYYEKNKEILDLLEADDLSFEDILNNFYEDEEYLFAAIELVSQSYLESEGQDFDARYRYEDIDEKGIIKKLDPSYIYDEYEEATETVDSKNIEINGSIIDTMDMIITKLKIDYPEDYQKIIYKFLLIDRSYDGIFYEFDIEDNSINQYKFLMMRMFARKYYEYISSKNLKELDGRERKIYSFLKEMPISVESILESFHRYGEEYIDIYFKLSFRSELAEKNIIRNFNSVTRKRLVEIDPLVLCDSSYYKALMVGNLFIILEENGVNVVIKHLTELATKNPNKCRELISELLIELYYKLKNSNSKIDIDNIFLEYLENNNYDLNFYMNDLINAQEFLKELLTRYLEFKKEEEFPRQTEDIRRDEMFDGQIKSKVFYK